MRLKLALFLGFVNFLFLSFIYAMFKSNILDFYGIITIKQANIHNPAK